MLLKSMGDAAGQCADSFHFLRLAQSLFNLYLLGDIPNNTDEVLTTRPSLFFIGEIETSAVI